MIWVIISIYIIILLSTFTNILFTPRLNKYNSSNTPFISILIPMRNEERNVVELLDNLKKLSYPNMEVIGLDDGSTDLTAEKWLEHTEGDDRFSLKYGKSLPEGWKGKVHACDQLAAFSTGDKLLFLDADARIHPSTLQHALGVMETYQSAMVTGFPKFPTKPFLSKLLVPFQHILVLSHLPIFVANKTTKPAFTAAHGAFLFVDRQPYEAVGGHEAIKDAMVDDVMLARLYKENGLNVSLVNVTMFVECFMYETNKEVWEGFQKNIFIGVGKKVFPAILVVIYYLMIYLLPIYYIVAYLETSYLPYLLPFVFILLTRIGISVATRESILNAFYFPLASISFSLLMFSAIYKDKSKRGYTWKGRTYS